MADSNNGRNSDSDFEEDQPGLDTLLPNLKNVVFIKAITSTLSYQVTG